MKKILLLVVCCVQMSCATVFTMAKTDECQRTKPAPNQPARKIRGFALAGNIAVPIAAVAIAGTGLAIIPIAIFTGVDFLDNAIYKPCPKKK